MKHADMPPNLDFGEGRSLRFTHHGDDIVGAIDSHPCLKGLCEPTCEGSISFAVPEAAAVANDHACWNVESWQPLTLSPSLLCRCCGNHGFVREGKWVDA